MKFENEGYFQNLESSVIAGNNNNVHTGFPKRMEVMKTYLKILFISGGLQILAFVVRRVVDYLTIKSTGSSMLPFYAFLVCMVLSMIIGIILSLKWYSSLRAKILGIVLLPTNYTLLTMFVIVSRGIKVFIKILQDLPSNFG